MKILSKYKLVSFVLILLLTILVFYGGTLRTWFQADEWDWIGRYTYYNSIGPVPFWEAFESSLFPNPRYRFTPLFDGIFSIETYFFGLNFTPYMAVSLFLHLCNSVLVFLFVSKLTLSKRLGYLTSFLFASSSIGQHAITWIFTSTNTQGATLFSLIACITFLNYLNNKKARDLILTFLFFFIALWFKETAISLFLILPSISLLNKLGKKTKLDRKVILWTIGFGLFYFSLRYALSRIGAIIHTQGYPDFGRFLTLDEYLQVLFWSPARALVDNFVFPNAIYWLSKIITMPFLSYLKLTPLTTSHDLFIENQATNLVTILIFIGIMAIFIKFYKKISTNHLKTSFILGIIIILSSALVSLLLSIRGTSALNPIFRSRDMYFSVAGASMCLAIVLSVIFERLKKRGFNTKTLLILFIIVYGLYHFININQFVLKKEERQTQSRKEIINTIYNTYPVLPQKTIFYVMSDALYYGHSKPSLPYQTGFGRTLLVWYTLKNNKIPKEFMKDDYLYMPFSEGYKEINHYGFGYFTDMSKLIAAIKDYNLTEESIFAFSYSGEKMAVTDKTNQTRITIGKEITNE